MNTNRDGSRSRSRPWSSTTTTRENWPTVTRRGSGPRGASVSPRARGRRGRCTSARSGGAAGNPVSTAPTDEILRWATSKSTAGSAPEGRIVSVVSGGGDTGSRRSRRGGSRDEAFGAEPPRGLVVASDACLEAARGIALALGGRGGGDECRGLRPRARQGGVAAVVFDRRGFREDFGRERVRVVVELREVSVGCGVRRRDIARSGLASDGIATRERVTLGWARRGEKRSDARGERTRAERGRGGGNRRKRKFPRSVARFSVVGARAMGCA